MATTSLCEVFEALARTRSLVRASGTLPQMSGRPRQLMALELLGGVLINLYEMQVQSPRTAARS